MIKFKTMNDENIIKKKVYNSIEIAPEKLSTQKKITIQGIPIYFPYEPYPQQKIYIEKVISTLNKEGSISALESPTGTGKTLCLLCSILAWVKYYNKKISIYYCTRTVSQINNLLKELNKTCYKLKTSFIASRKHTCLAFTKNEKNKKDNTQLKDICDKLRNNIFEKKKSQEKTNFYEEEKNYEICQYYKTTEYYKHLNIYKNIIDIEDLLKKGKSEFFCPYYYNIAKSKIDANLTIMTYNYVLNPYIRRGLNLLEKNSIIILDEAHNICENFEHYDSNKININELEKIKNLLQILLDYINANDKQIYKEIEDINPIFKISKEDLNKEITTIKKFISDVNNIDIKDNLILEKIKQYKRFDDSKSESYFIQLEFFKEIFKNFKPILYSEICKKYNTLKKEDMDLLNKFYQNKVDDCNQKTKLPSLIKLLYKFSEFLNLLESFEIKKEEDDSLPPAPPNFENVNDDSRSVKNEIIEKENKIIKKKEELNSFRFILSKKENLYIFEIICIDPSYGLKEYLKIKPYCTILTSGTLSINSIENLLKIRFNETLSNDHVIQKNQFMLHIINGYKNYNKIYDYSFTYENRKNEFQISALGNQIYNLAKSVKIGGVLVYFQSFEYLKNCYLTWLEEGIVKKYSEIKEVLFDLSFNRAHIEEEIIEAKKKNNLLLFTVYRGVNSEGINFPNDEARMVICVGVPFQNISDIKVQIKRDFLDKRNKEEKNGFSGKEWYREDAMNAVNQALGRLIRNVNDYGIMICFGIEFTKNMRYFTKWMRNNIEIVNLNEDDQNYYSRLSKFLDENRKYFENNKQQFDVIDDLDLSEDNNEFDENENYFWNNEEKDKFSISLENTISKINKPYIGYKRFRDEYNDEDY